ncbi:unnamed protein product [Echinostoma caproni]|uniref:ThrE_2 domain-containing protein n=1 Tax=Echinostoma caproni TaxID=27848 RepID=A0A182ZZG1_9TREM|nr:unnamed protein product [Echinostoma caproni]
MCRTFAAEALGLGMIIFIVKCHAAEHELKSPFSGAASAAFAVAMWTVGPVSGLQLTPILSVVFLIIRRINFVYCILGMAGQRFGAVIGLALASRLVPGLLDNAALNLHVLEKNVNDGQVFGLECLCSSLLIICCLSTLDELRKLH